MKEGTSSIWILTLKDFRKRASSHDPTPGGGSVAIVVAVLGCTLISMALKISARKDNADAQLQGALRKLRILVDRLSDYADADIKLFKHYLAANRRWSRTAHEQTARGFRLTQAAESATDILLKAGQDMLSAIKLAEAIIEVTELNVVSDVGAGCAILDGALRALLYDIDSNLKDLQPDIAAEFRNKRAAIQMEADALSIRIDRETESFLNQYSQLQ
jgi:formiminotetrahydrofolate cyclodeaminase